MGFRKLLDLDDLVVFLIQGPVDVQTWVLVKQTGLRISEDRDAQFAGIVDRVGCCLLYTSRCV